MDATLDPQKSPPLNAPRGGRFVVTLMGFEKGFDVRFAEIAV